jgi:hypothetical protein
VRPHYCRVRAWIISPAPSTQDPRALPDLLDGLGEPEGIEILAEVGEAEPGKDECRFHAWLEDREAKRRDQRNWRLVRSACVAGALAALALGQLDGSFTRLEALAAAALALGGPWVIERGLLRGKLREASRRMDRKAADVAASIEQRLRSLGYRAERVRYFDEGVRDQDCRALEA